MVHGQGENAIINSVRFRLCNVKCCIAGNQEEEKRHRTKNIDLLDFHDSCSSSVLIFNQEVQN
jgi:hypothetical protein